MNNPLSTAEIETATEIASTPRYAIVPKLFGHDFAPEMQEVRPDLEATMKLPVVARFTHSPKRPGIRQTLSVFCVIFLGVLSFAAFSAALAVSITGFTQ